MYAIQSSTNLLTQHTTPHPIHKHINTCSLHTPQPAQKFLIIKTLRTWTKSSQAHSVLRRPPQVTNARSWAATARKREERTHFPIKKRGFPHHHPTSPTHSTTTINQHQLINISCLYSKGPVVLSSEPPQNLTKSSPDVRSG
jgi:hypothetical protein